MRCAEVNWNELVLDRNNGGSTVSLTAGGNFLRPETARLKEECLSPLQRSDFTHAFLSRRGNSIQALIMANYRA